MYIRLVELPTCRANALDRASLHITYMAVELRTKKRGGWPMHAQGMGYAVCMYHSACISADCRPVQKLEYF